MDKKTILEDVEGRIQSALKSGDALTASVCRMAKSELTNARIALRSGKSPRDMTLEDEISVIKKILKRNEDAAEQFLKAGSHERAAQEKSEMAVLQGYLPEQASPEDVKAFVLETIQSLKAPNIGQVVAAVKQKWGASVDMKQASTYIKEALSK